MKYGFACAAAAVALAWAAPACAQDAEEPAQPAAAEAPAPADGDTVATVSLPSADEKIDVAAIEVPSLDYAPGADAAKGFDKYYYFHRDDTDFATALADLRDCDGLSRGLSSPLGNATVPYPYAGTMAGALGGAISNLMVAAIFGSAQVRAARRVNMRRCMFYKGYQRYGLPKDIWQKFTFEEGFSQLAETPRQACLKQPA
jgi:hypothetical protein